MFVKTFFCFSYLLLFFFINLLILLIFKNHAIFPEFLNEENPKAVLVKDVKTEEVKKEEIVETIKPQEEIESSETTVVKKEGKVKKVQEVKSVQKESKESTEIKKAKEELRCETSDAILQKLVIQGKGSQFEKNIVRNNENLGTLIIQLPSLFTGSHLIVHYGNEEETENFDYVESKYGLLYSAFYGKCTYESTPLESGHRFSLVYQLKDKKDSLNSPLNQLKESTKLKEDIVNQLTEVRFRREPDRFGGLFSRFAFFDFSDVLHKEFEWSLIFDNS